MDDVALDSDFDLGIWSNAHFLLLPTQSLGSLPVFLASKWLLEIGIPRHTAHGRHPHPDPWEGFQAHPLPEGIFMQLADPLVLGEEKDLTGLVPKRTEHRDLNRYLYTRLHSSIFHNPQKLEGAQVPIDR